MFVELDEVGEVVSAFASPQLREAIVEISDDDARLTAYYEKLAAMFQAQT
jgi:hypothetical protein